MIVNSFTELPAAYSCKKCGAEKPIAEMVVTRLHKMKKVMLRPRCKACHNLAERGNRREYKTKYLRGWRFRNQALNESYWRQRSVEKRDHINALSYRRIQKDHAALLIQGRLRRRTTIRVTIKEARALARKFGPCYPTPHGLTPAGRRECERMRSRARNAGQKINPVEVRMMVYEDGFFIKPSLQKLPYRRSAEQLKRWHERRKQAHSELKDAA